MIGKSVTFNGASRIYYKEQAPEMNVSHDF